VSWTRIAILVAVVSSLLVSAGCASKTPKERDEQAERRKRTVILTSKDDVRVGQEAAKQVSAEIGTLDDPELVAYVEGIGKKLLRALPHRDFAYRFKIVDQMEPNAFALPGGHIFVSRGLLALVNSEDELACVLGHEIIHAARRHSARQQAVARSLPGFVLPRSRAQTLAAYGRDMEREADELGQRLAAAVGYDPMGMATFMRRLDQRERLLIGAPRNPTFFDTHPGTRERASANMIRSRELRWSRAADFGDPRERHLDQIDGMIIGDRPETGVFDEDYFYHPALDFEIRFPKGWRMQNSASTVGAQSPRGDAAVFLTADLPAGDLVEVAEGWIEEQREGTRIDVQEKKRVKLGAVDGIRYKLVGSSGGFSVDAFVTFFPFADATWRFVGLNVSQAGSRYLPQILLTTRSFRPLSEEHRASIRSDRLRIVLAHAGENLAQLGDRTDNAWPPAVTGLINGHLGNEIFEGGEWMKILRRETPERLPTPAGS